MATVLTVALSRKQRNSRRAAGLDGLAHPLTLCELRLSSMTTSPGESSGTRNCLTWARNAVPLMALSGTSGATSTALHRAEATPRWFRRTSRSRAISSGTIARRQIRPAVRPAKSWPFLVSGTHSLGLPRTRRRPRRAARSGDGRRTGLSLLAANSGASYTRVS